MSEKCNNNNTERKNNNSDYPLTSCLLAEVKVSCNNYLQMWRELLFWNSPVKTLFLLLRACRTGHSSTLDRKMMELN